MTEIIDSRKIVYQSEDGALKLPMSIDLDSVWLCLSDIAKLFDVDKKTIKLMVQNILNEEGYQLESVRRKLSRSFPNNQPYQTPEQSLDTKPAVSDPANHINVAFNNKKVYLINHYNLEVVLSVGYKLSTKKAIEFRKWVNKTLKTYISNGFVLNARSLSQNTDKLEEAQKNIQFILKNTGQDSLNDEAWTCVVDLIKEYNNTLSTSPDLHNSDPSPKKIKSLTLGNYLRAILILKHDILSDGEASNLFGQQYRDKFTRIINILDERFNGIEVHNTVAQKASLLFYLIIKEKPFADGNKRIASFLMLYLLDHNDCLFRDNGEQIISDSSLYALSKIISNSSTYDKQTILKLMKQILEAS